jgi:hypothetical protein
VGARGLPRRSKAKRPTDAVADAKIVELTLKSLEYLEREVEIYTASPGNHAEVIRILKALADYGGDDGPVRDVGSARKDAFRLDSSS